jgi:tetratricopeptide (TPR) repeat protein
MEQEPARLLQQGISLGNNGQHREALAVYDRLLTARPDLVEALNNRGIVLIQLRQFGEAVSSFDRALAINPRLPEAWSNRGSAQMEAGDPDSALESFARAIELRPDAFGALAGSARLRAERGQWLEALALIDRALVIEPSNIEILGRRAHALLMLKRHDEALAAYEIFLGKESMAAGALNDYGTALVASQRFEEALSAFDKAIALQPDFPEALNNRGLTLCRLLKYEEAVTSFERALQIYPDYVGAIDNLGIALAKLGRNDEAIARSDEALMIEPDYAKAHLHQGITRLRMGDYPGGLRLYEWRWIEGGIPLWRQFAQPLWMGRDSLEGKSILIHSEQGLGDAIQFVRYVPLLAKRGARVLLAVPRVLLPLMQSLPGVERFYAWGDAVPPSDFHCPLLSLPLAFETTVNSIPGNVPYLRIDADRPKAVRKELTRRGKKLIGLCWRGNPSYPEDRERSMGLDAMAPLLSVPGASFVSLQKELTDSERRIASSLGLHHLGSDFDDTAEVVAAVDVVISVDTVWAHLAGALGKPVWIFLSPAPHWVWLSKRTDSPWYPSARLFRQRIAGEWKPTVAKVCDELKRVCGK